MDLLAAATAIAEQIPVGDVYEDEYLFCWLAVGKAALVTGELAIFERALKALPENRSGAELRTAALVGPVAIASRVLANFFDRMPFWDRYLFRGEWSDLAPRFARAYGLAAAANAASTLPDHFTRTTFLVTLSENTRDVVEKRHLLVQAHEAADRVDEDHDYALKWIVAGYIEAGALDEAERAIDGMADASIRLDNLEALAEARTAAGEVADAARVDGERDAVLRANPGTRGQAEQVAEAESLLLTDIDGSPSYDSAFSTLGRDIGSGSYGQAIAAIKERFPTRFCPPGVGLPDEEFRDLILFQLRAVSGYARNDLKVEYLTDLVTELRRAGRELPEEAAQAVDGDFLHLEPPSAPSITSRDPSFMTLDEFAVFLFARPVTTTNEESRFMNRSLADDPWIGDETALVRVAAELLERFGEIAPRYSPEQVGQAVWALNSGHLRLNELLQRPDLPAEAAVACLRAAYHVFADYLARVDISDPSGGFYMWWDDYGWAQAPDYVQAAAVETATRVLQLENRACREAALHGLNHLHPARGVREAITAFIHEHGAALDPELLSYAYACRDRQGM